MATGTSLASVAPKCSRPPMSSSASASRLSTFLAMTPQDVDRMAEATRAFQDCLKGVAIPPDAVPDGCTSNASRLPPNQSSGSKKGGEPTPMFLDSTEALHKLLDRKDGSLALHEMLIETASQCKHVIVESFLPRMQASGVSDSNASAGLVIFHEMDKSSKLKTVFEILAATSSNNNNPHAENADSAPIDQQQQDSDHKENSQPNNDAPAPLSATSYDTPQKLASTPCLDSDGAKRLFLTILTAISCCVQHKEDDDISLKPVVTQDEDIVMKDSFEHPPKEMTKTGDSGKAHDVASLTATTGQTTQSGASIGLSNHLKKEIEAAAVNASQRLVDFALSKKVLEHSKKTPRDSDEPQGAFISFDTFGEWYNSGGCSVVPWLELLHLTKWRINASTLVPASSASIRSTHPTGSMSSKKVSRKPVPKSTIKSRPAGSASLSSMLKEDAEQMRKMTNGNSSAQQHRQRHSRTVVTFDFANSAKHGVATTKQPLCINISEESLLTLRSLVYRSGLIYRSAAEVCKIIMRMSHKRLWDGRPLVTLRRDDFRHVIRTLVPASGPTGSATRTPQNPPSSADLQNFGMILEDFFACFEGNFHQSTTAYHPLSHDEVNAKELAVGFCFLCAGNKSTKLATGFELLDDARSGYLTEQQLMRFLRAYLTMMVGMSLLKDDHAKKRKPLSYDSKEEMRAAVENGAHWTLRHFLKTVREKHPESFAKDEFSFEIFAEWYSKGGFSVAPWLELLDLNKLVSLLGESESFAALPQAERTNSQRSSQSSARECRSSHRRQHHNRTSAPPAQVLFTFPLANQRSLIVLREDAIYVRGVVEQLGALTLTAADIWQTLVSEIKKRPGLRGSTKPRSKKSNVEPDKNTLLDLKSFLEMMEVVLMSASGSSRKRAAAGSSKLSPSVQEILSNFFHSYDLKEVSMVALNELMGGLSLLCGGKKSQKLAFSFGVFDGRPRPKTRKSKNKPVLKDQSLDGSDLYLFLRSFLIILFSCCCQTLEMSDSSVDRYIGDTATMVAEDVMRYQWHKRKKERIDFDEFGEWYNEGGFEIAPWLELLDLKKWVLVDNFDALDTQPPPPPTSSGPTATLSPKLSPKPSKQSPNCPPPPPEDVLDPSFFEDNDDIMHMDSIDEMDIMLMPSHDKESDMLPVSKFTYSPSQEKVSQQPAGDDGQPQSLKFHLLSEEEQGGFMLSISQKRIRHFRQIMTDCGLHEISTETACTSILNYASGSKSKLNRTITKAEFEAATCDVLGIKDQKAGAEDHKCLLDVLAFVFQAFDLQGNGKPDALEVACGFTVLCRGKKSDKLEYAFEVLDREKKGHLSRDDMLNYMRSFLTVLLGIACCPALETDVLEDTLTTMNGDEACNRTHESVIRAVDSGSKWAVAQAFKRRGDVDSITFDDFAAWYTEEGHISIPWIELLALRKWLFI